MTIETLAAWLRCPRCEEDLGATGALVLGCARGHRYDTNKRGFVNLVKRPGKMHSDTSDMLDARDRILDDGLYSPIVDDVASKIARALRSGDAAEVGSGNSQTSTRSPLSLTVLDAGCGTGHYLRAVLDRVSGEANRGLAMDLSPVAVQRAIRGRPDIDALVADTWERWPVRDSSASVVLDIFAPRNFAEFHRVLRPDGLLIVVVPAPSHLIELRKSGALLGLEAGKRDRLLSSASECFELESDDNVSFGITVDELAETHLVEMGPSAHHQRRLSDSKHNSEGTTTAPKTLTASVDLLVFRRR